MTYLIDGHNLIPKIPGLSLYDLDDEIHLIEMLQVFCRKQRKQVDVYFDKAPTGHAGIQHFGQVTAHFIQRESTADIAIQKRLARLAKTAPNWTVVSSDGEVQFAARAARAKVMSAESFWQLLRRDLDESQIQTGELRPEGLGPNELDEWLKLFGQDPGQKR